MNIENQIEEALPPLAKKSFWENLKDAIKGTEADYTTISIRKAIFLLAIPMILELVMESTFAVVDIYFVGKLGASAISTVGLTETYLFILYSVAMGLSMAVTAIIARRTGEKNTSESGNAAVQSIILGLIAALPLTIAGIFFAKDLLALMGADAWSINEGYKYTQYMLGGNAVIVLLFVINAIFRGAGDAAIAMRVLWIANIINMALDPLLIFGWGIIPAFGIEGAAMATNIGRGIGVAVQVWVLFKGGKHLKVTFSQIYIDSKIMLNIVKTSLGGIGQMIIAMTSWIFLIRILAELGAETVAGSTIAIRIMMFTMMPAWGLSNAAATLVGQNLGAGKPDRAEKSVWKIGFYNMIFLVLVSVVYFFYNEELMRLFTDDARVIAVGAEWIQIVSYGYFIYGWWMVSVQAFNGAGDTTTPTKINVVFFWLFQIPLAYSLAITFGWQESGVFWGMFISEIGVGLFTLWLFTKGKWKETKV
ncbi:MAG: MATE family efflux transporter [Ignavibacteriae bacterium HGW-Ignavibacteriae-4]|nr:MAG: MATE family efflux transporter [Ignavibacteriae bacterium HGW-Ignavibacteriae-4]